MVEEEGHIFELNKMWANLSDYLSESSKDASDMVKGLTFYDKKYITEDKIHEALFTESEDPILDCLTQECL